MMKAKASFCTPHPFSFSSQHIHPTVILQGPVTLPGHLHWGSSYLTQLSLTFLFPELSQHWAFTNLTLIHCCLVLLTVLSVSALVRTLSQTEPLSCGYSLQHPAPCSVWTYGPHTELLTKSWFFVHHHSLYMWKVTSGPLGPFWRTYEWLDMVSGEKKQKNKSNLYARQNIILYTHHFS